MNDSYILQLIWLMRLTYVLPVASAALLKHENFNIIISRGIFLYGAMIISIELFYVLVSDNFNFVIVAFHLYDFLYPILILFVLRAVMDRPLERALVLALIFLFLVVAIGQMIYEGPFVLYSETSAIGLLLIIFTCIYYLLKLFREAKVQNLIHFLPFWFSTAFLFQAAAVFFLSLFSEVLLSENSYMFRSLWQIQYFVAIFINLTLTIGLWKTRLRSSS